MTYEVPMNEKMIFLHPRGFQCNNGMHFIKINFFSLPPPDGPLWGAAPSWGMVPPYPPMLGTPAD